MVKGSPNPKKLVKKSLHSYRPEIYNCYVSHTHSKTGIAGEELHDSSATVWRNWQFYAAVAAILIAPLLLWKVGRSFYVLGHPKVKGAQQPERSDGTAPPSPHPGTVPAGFTKEAPIGPAYSKTWRLTGHVQLPGKPEYYLVAGSGGERYVPARVCMVVGGNRLCYVDGELVTNWTGPDFSPVTQFVASTLKPAG